MGSAAFVGGKHDKIELQELCWLWFVPLTGGSII